MTKVCLALFSTSWIHADLLIYADAADLITSILQLDPLLRPSLKAILSHRFFTSPPTAPAYDTRRTASPHLAPHESFPPVIPEETSTGSPTDELSNAFDHTPLLASPPLQASPPLLSHALAASDVSDASFFSTASGSDAGHSRSGATTPITSDDGDPPLSVVREGKRKALDQDGDDGDLTLFHRNESQTTIGRGRSAELHATPRGSMAGKALMLGTTEEVDEGRAAMSSAYQSHLGLSAPSLQRNASSSSSTSLASMGGSPVPIHSRTPSRTKRRSVGSTFSERLFSLDEVTTSSPIDYLSLLSLPSPSPLSTPNEQTLLEALTSLGFDTGQIVHSIKTDACDSCAAIWWMLKRKADEREREKVEVEQAISSLARPGLPKQTSSPLAQMFGARVEEPMPSPGFSSSDDGSVLEMSTTSPIAPAATSEDRLGRYLQQTGESLLAPLPPYVPPVEPGSPSRKTVPQSNSKDHLTVSPSPSPSPGLSPPSSDPGTPMLGLGSDLVEPVSEGKSKRARSASVSMLARATSAIGSSLALKKSTDAVKDDSKVEDERSTPTTPLASLFLRKSSIPNETELRSSTPSSPSRSTSTPDLLGTPIGSSVSVPSPRSPGGISASASQDTFNTVTSEASSSTRASKPSKKGTKGGIFMNFKMWFGDDRRKRKRNPSPMYEGGSASRAGTGSRRSFRQEGSFASSPLKKPPLGSRRSSSNSIVPPSRRSSMNSIHRVRTNELPAHYMPSLGHNRRCSDGSRASNSDREHSRPSSLRSVSGGDAGRRPRHSKAGSVSSTGSFRVHTSPVLRRPPTTTTVRRHHGSQGRHHRNRSTSSSINTRHSSSSSVGDDEDRLEEPKSADPILEEDETAEDERALEERHRTLRKLSGDFSSGDFPSTTVHASSSSVSRFSLDSHHSTGRHSPVIFSSHKTRHIFGAPSQPVPSSIAHKISHSTLRPALRDVFANKDAEGEWFDEEDDLGGYGGGLGQAPTRSGARSESVSSTHSTSSSLFSSGTTASTHPSSQLESSAGHDEGVNVFEGRYASVGQDTPVVGMGSGGAGAWRAVQANRAPAFRSALMIEEEEEEEEE